MSAELSIRAAVLLEAAAVDAECKAIELEENEEGVYEESDWKACRERGAKCQEVAGELRADATRHPDP